MTDSTALTELLERVAERKATLPPFPETDDHDEALLREEAQRVLAVIDAAHDVEDEEHRQSVQFNVLLYALADVTIAVGPPETAAGFLQVMHMLLDSIVAERLVQHHASKTH